VRNEPKKKLKKTKERRTKTKTKIKRKKMKEIEKLFCIKKFPAAVNLLWIIGYSFRAWKC